MAAEAEELETSGPKSQMWKHEAMVEWINATYGVDLDQMSAAEIIAYAFAYRGTTTNPGWRQSDEYAAIVEEHKAIAEQEKAERAEARKVKAAEKAAAEAAEAEKAPAKKAIKATKAPTKAAKATKAPAKAPAKRAAKRATKASAEDPFS